MGILEEQEINYTATVCSECGQITSPVIIKKFDDEPYEITQCKKCGCGLEGIKKLDGTFQELPC